MPAGAVEHAGRRGTKRFNVKVWKKFTVNVSHKTGSLKVIVAYNVDIVDIVDMWQPQAAVCASSL